MTTDPGEKTSELLASLESARVIDLEQPRFAGMPMFPANAPNFAFMLHRRHERGLEKRTSAAGMILTADHAGTHVDAFCHQAEDMQMLGGIAVDASNQGPSGMGVMTAEGIPPIIRRGVLIDLAGSGRLPAKSLVQAETLESAAAEQGVTVRPGDVLLVRTGWGSSWSDTEGYIAAGGMARSSAEWAAAKGVYAVGADNMSWDVPGYTDPDLGHTLPCHSILLVHAGIYIFENLFLDELGAAGVSEFVFVSLPLKLVGATGSPTRPVAIVVQADE
ncbi:MAG: cyclase family protein [Nocardioidaceae bacterium]